jgi:hypothetical protein
VRAASIIEISGDHAAIVDARSSGGAGARIIEIRIPGAVIQEAVDNTVAAEIVAYDRRTVIDPSDRREICARIVDVHKAVIATLGAGVHRHPSADNEEEQTGNRKTAELLHCHLEPPYRIECKAFF